MALVINDRVRETTTVTGTNDATLLGAVTGFQAFSVIGNGNTTYYTISDQSGGNWEVGLGTFSSVGPTLARTTVLDSSDGGAKVSFPAGTKDVFITYPSEKAVYLDGSGNITPSSVGPLTVTSLTDSGLTSGRVTYAGTSGVLQDDADFTFNGTTVTMANDASISGLTVGKGGGAVATNTAVGNGSMAATATGAANSAFGGSALAANTSGYYNSAFGYLSSAGTTTGNGNSSFGRASLYTNTTGASNTAIGQDSLFSNTTASNNTAVGYQAGYSNTTGTNNFFGGFQAGYTNSTGSQLTAVGFYSLSANTTGTDNSAFGGYALGKNTTGNYNVAVGRQALQENTTASNNTAVGYQAGYSNTTGDLNTFIGRSAGGNVTTGFRNTFVGHTAGGACTTGNYNTFMGIGNGDIGAGSAITTGSKNTIIGGFGGNQGGLDIRTASNYIVLSDGDGNPCFSINGSGQAFLKLTGYDVIRPAFKQSGFGYSTTSYGALVLGATAENQTVCINYDPSINASPGFSGTGGEMMFKRGIAFITPNSANTAFFTQFTMTDGVTSGDFNDTSDIALKTNIKSIDNGLDTINRLRPVTFDWKQEGKGSRSGFIAQEVETVLPHDVIGEDYIEPNRETGELGTLGKSINTTGIVAHLVKAVQELNAKVEAQALEIAQLKGN